MDGSHMFHKQVTDINWPDLAGLLASGASESIGLEFKSEMPNKEEYLKKVSSLANTYGGHVIIGALGRADGQLLGIPGIPPVQGCRQKLVQWAYEGCVPPVEVFVSDKIMVQSSASQACYVVFVPMSGATPHFLTARRGCYIRTDEYSQRFEPGLATYEEMEHLQHRRGLASSRREDLRGRAVARFVSFIESQRRSLSPIGATMRLSVAPQFPVHQLIEPEPLRALVRNQRIAWRWDGFPLTNDPAHVQTQLDSALTTNTGEHPTLLEVSTWGQQFYGTLIERLHGEQTGDQPVQGIHLWETVGHILAFLEYAKQMCGKLGYDGPFVATVELVGVRGKPFVHFPYNVPTPGPASPFDDDVKMEHFISSSDLSQRRDGVAKELLRGLFFALNWPEQAASDAQLEVQLSRGYSFNQWPGRAEVE